MANIRTFSLSWQSNSGASATGLITIDTDLIRYDIEPPVPIPISYVQNLSVSISGAPAGDGSYGKADFSEVLFYCRAPINFNQELVGQSQGNFPPFGTLDAQGGGGDFNLVGKGIAPDGVAAFTIVTNGKQDPNATLTITSIAPT